MTIWILQELLNSFHKHHLKELKKEANNASDEKEKAAKQDVLNTHKGVVSPGGQTWHDKPRHAAKEK